LLRQREQLGQVGDDASARGGERMTGAGYQLQVRFQKPLLLPGSLRLLASAKPPSGQFQLRGQDELACMAGSWRALD
jgi:hypothetical protein